jgi:hypothetical protein
MSEVKENVIIVKKDTLEIPSMRTEFSKTFYVTDTQRRLVSSRAPIHVKDKNGEWVDITCEIKRRKATYCPYDGKLLKDKIGYQMIKDDLFIEIELLGFDYKEPIIEGNIAKWENVSKGVDVVIQFTPTHATIARILKNKSARKTCDYRIIMPEKRAEHISFGGMDSKSRKVHLEQKEKSVKKIKRKGKELVEKVITDRFLQETVNMDEVTRKREWVKEVEYPVVIH